MNIDKAQLDIWKRKLHMVQRDLDNLLDMHADSSMKIRVVLEIMEISKKLKAVHDEVMDLIKPEGEEYVD